MAASTDTGELLDFTIRPNGDAVLSVSDPEDGYAHSVTITAQELADIAEASLAAREIYARNHLRIGASHTWPAARTS